jgi:hypothetical protein
MSNHCSIAMSVIAALAATGAQAGVTTVREHATNPVGDIVLSYVGCDLAATGRG